MLQRSRRFLCPMMLGRRIVVSQFVHGLLPVEAKGGALGNVSVLAYAAIFC